MNDRKINILRSDIAREPNGGVGTNTQTCCRLERFCFINQQSFVHFAVYELNVLRFAWVSRRRVQNLGGEEGEGGGRRGSTMLN